MKQIILIALTLILGVGCKKDKDTEPELQLISGKWYLETENGVAVSDCEKKSSVEFTNDGRFLFEAYAIYDVDCELINGEGTYTQSGNSVTITLGTEPPATSTYSISGGILTVNSPNPDTGTTDVATYDKTPD